MKEIKKVVVLGGGTAGWLTALFAERHLGHNASITVVESSQIGVIGVGESTTPPLIWALDHLGIPLSEIVKNAGATIKNGIKFTNWSNDGKYYYHNFTSLDNHTNTSHSSNFMQGMDYTNILGLMDVFFDTYNEKINLSAIASELNKVPMIYHGNANLDSNEILNYEKLSAISLQFNAIKMADFLKRVGLSRGIQIVDKVVTSVEADQENNITALNFDSDSIEADFVFDCSGMAKVLIGKHYNADWQKFNHLPVDSAIPFFLDHDGDIPPYTEAIAMKYGWMWRVPLQDRFGCGYVFDSKYINHDEAKAEVEAMLGKEISVNKNISFECGYISNPWINNCVAIGLSSGFVEPLESTSIQVTIECLKEVFKDVGSLQNIDGVPASEYNKTFSNTMNRIQDFIYFHYMAGRSDTEFWDKFNDINNAPDFVKSLMNKWDYVVPEHSDFDRSMFRLDNWFQVAYGVGRLNKPLIISYLANNGIVQQYGNNFNYIKEKQKQKAKMCVGHKEMIKILRES